MKASFYPSRSETEAATCGTCGRMLGATFYHVCHVCGAAYCYVHMPERCNHGRFRTPFALRVSQSAS